VQAQLGAGVADQAPVEVGGRRRRLPLGNDALDVRAARPGRVQHVDEVRLEDHVEVPLDRPREQRALVPEGSVEALAAEPRDLLELGQTRRRISALPEQGHGPIEDLVGLEAARATRHGNLLPQDGLF